MRYMLSILPIILFSLYISITPQQLNAESKDEPVVLVVYSSKSGTVDEHQRLLDMLIGHFTSSITFKHTSEVREADFEHVTHVFYYGQSKEHLSTEIKQMIEQFNGTVTAIGFNADQLQERFSFIELVSEELVTKISLRSDEEKSVSIMPDTILNVNVTTGSDVLVKGSYGKGVEYPLFITNGNTHYYGTSKLEPPFSIFLGEVLHEVFAMDHSHEHPAYIRLEDIHPLVEPEKVMKVAKELKRRDIPYMVAVIPVYTNPDTKERHYFKDSPQLLKALKYIQDNGGSIVLHGYTHQFRDDETGEGFEFWDVDHNMPIYHGPDDEVLIKTENEFDTPLEYENYLEELLAFENEYIESKLTRGVQELANYGIYPLAFEAPHYTMSQNGYAQTSQYFSTYVGQIQLSDDNWEIMNTSPYITTPTFLEGMLLLPETIGFIDKVDPKAVEKMIQNIHDYSIVRDGIIAGFYHPFLDEDHFEKFTKVLDELEQIEGLQWIDLKQMNNNVQVEHVHIKSENGEVIVDIDRLKLFFTSIDFLLYHIKKVAVNATWLMVGAGTVAVTLFISYIVITRKRSRKSIYYKRRGIIG
ncbi:DUF2334 domain-containing protein [Ornithinibacillus sp. L9]|uniref:DUF2334 domain-containing protein n=1 Tax=Ornithinibacillus caprae TaxID=2678566 RepID=A0A6N8FG31_9BACI|nr:DUF2334 domain-containing protein [Ornithinibacillus caprae]MUK88622.1 DUF2334 domain-containing protein [Ornithinibacillus caprae]